jgi:hypothetical protein
MTLVVQMLIVILEGVAQSVNVDQAMLEIRLSIVLWSHAVKIHVEPMLNVNPKVDLPFVNVPEVIMVILTLIVSEILVVQILVVQMQSVKIVEMLLYADAHLIMLVIRMFLAHLIPVLKIPVVPIQSVQLVDKDLYVDVFEDLLEVQTAELDAKLILVQSMTFVEPTLNAVIKEDAQLVPVYLDIKEIPILDV